MKAVATVVMNRVRVPFGEYHRVCQGDIRKVIYQKGQFDCVMSLLEVYLILKLFGPIPQNKFIMI